MVRLVRVRTGLMLWLRSWLSRVSVVLFGHTDLLVFCMPFSCEEVAYGL